MSVRLRDFTDTYEGFIILVLCEILTDKLYKSKVFIIKITYNEIWSHCNILIYKDDRSNTIK